MVLERYLYAGERLCSMCGFSIFGTRTGFSANACRLWLAGPSLCSVVVVALSVPGSAYTLQLLEQKPPDWRLSCAGRQVGLEDPPGGGATKYSPAGAAHLRVRCVCRLSRAVWARTVPCGWCCSGYHLSSGYFPSVNAYPWLSFSSIIIPRLDQ